MRVGVAHQNPVYRVGIEQTLREAYEQVASAPTVEMFVYTPDVLVTEPSQLDGSVPAIVYVHRQEVPNLREVVMLLTKRGARGIVTTERSDELVDAVAQVGAGRLYFCQSLQHPLWDEVAQMVEAKAQAPALPCQRCDAAMVLSERERVVLEHVAAGRTNAQIARRLNISPATAKNHVANILRKMGAQSRVQAGVRALQLGLILENRADANPIEASYPHGPSVETAPA